MAKPKPAKDFETSPLADQDMGSASDPPPSSSETPVAAHAGTPTHDPNSTDGRLESAQKELAQCRAEIARLGDVRKPVTDAVAIYTNLSAEKPKRIKAIEDECGRALQAVREAEKLIAETLAYRDTLNLKIGQIKKTIASLEKAKGDELKARSATLPAHLIGV